MPTFGFTDQELNDLTRYFAFLDRASYPFLTAEHATAPARWAAGKKVFDKPLPNRITAFNENDGRGARYALRGLRRGARRGYQHVHWERHQFSGERG